MLSFQCHPLGCCSMTSAPSTQSTSLTSDIPEARPPQGSSFPNSYQKMPQKSQPQLPSELGNFNLKRILSKTATGQQVLTNYTKNGFLVSKEQSYLALTIIDYHFITNKRMSPSLLSQYAAEIIKLFPSETIVSSLQSSNFLLKKKTIFCFRKLTTFLGIFN